MVVIGHSSAELMKRLITCVHWLFIKIAMISMSYLMELIRLPKHALCCSPSGVILKWDDKGCHNSTFLLNAFKVCDMLTRSLNLDGEGVYCSNDIN